MLTPRAVARQCGSTMIRELCTDSMQFRWVSVGTSAAPTQKENPPGGVAGRVSRIGAGDRGAGAPIGGCETWRGFEPQHALVARPVEKVQCPIKKFAGATQPIDFQCKSVAERGCVAPTVAGLTDSRAR